MQPHRLIQELNKQPLVSYVKANNICEKEFVLNLTL